MQLEVGASGGRDSSPVRRKASVLGPRSDSSRSNDNGKHEVFVGSGDLGVSNEEVDSSVPTYWDIRNITIRRSKLAKWFMEPFFEEVIIGCFVRVGIGMSSSGQSFYRLCMVTNVEALGPEREYKLKNRTTHKYSNLIWGNKSSASRWQMTRISDMPPLEKEFNEWKCEVERSGGRMPSIEDVKEKREAIDKINSFLYSGATLKQLLQEKKSALSKPFNVAAEKKRLRREMEVALSRRDDAEVERIQARLRELVASWQAKEMDAKAARLAEMNRKNRAENFKNASELRPVNTSLKAGEAGYDPFSRRWTRSRNYYMSNPGEGGEATAVAANGDDIGAIGPGASNGTGTAPASEAGVAATVAALEAAADVRKLVDTSAPVDKGTELNSPHDFELPISLAGLEKLGGPQGAWLGFMARKQKIETVIGYKVLENDGRRHPLTLTVTDYKRRRGLL